MFLFSVFSCAVLERMFLFNVCFRAQCLEQCSCGRMRRLPVGGCGKVR